MAEETKVETQTTTEPKIEEKMIPQSEVNSLAGNSREEGRKSVLKELGIENIEDTKKSLNDFKKFQDSQKTELQKAQDDNTILINENKVLRANKKQGELKDTVGDVLKDMEIEASYSKTIVKLIDTDDMYSENEIDMKKLKETITKVIETDLPILVNNTNKKIGVEKKDLKQKTSSKSYIDNKYKNNPYYKR